jgi:hypothetical protein
LDPFAVPLLNTFLLISSGAFITYGHHALIAGKRVKAIISIFITILLAVIFTALQGFEYYESSFSFSDSVFGSTFFASTGLHGLITRAPTNLIKKNSKFKENYILTKNTITTKSYYPIFKSIISKKQIVSPKGKNIFYNNQFRSIVNINSIDKLKVNSNNKSIYLDMSFLQ